MKQVAATHPEIPVSSLQKVTLYYETHLAQVLNKDFATIIDFNLPSTAKRMHVIDLKSAEVTSYLVAHGKDSGDLYALNFSNEPNSYMSSLGIYLTGEPYDGKHGLSMKLHGEESTNSNAYSRDIVMHGAVYVSEDFIKQYGRLGRSEGCPAVEMQYSSELVNKLANGSVYLIDRQ
jgi:hypothetical protein